jgi:hypothetical protein
MKAVRPVDCRSSKGSRLERRRIRVACAVTVAFVCLFVILAVQQNQAYRTTTIGALEYLASASASLPEDPLGISSPSLELVGVSASGMVVGYAAEGAVAQTMVEVDRTMRAKGWSVLGMSTEGISSYVWQGELHQRASDSARRGASESSSSSEELPPVGVFSSSGASPSAGAYVLFICSERDGGVTLVAELL